ncbi:MAG: hypothetical protein HQ568_09165 [Calditrichaeota bacterium]|nr:hypothetical protein [Calditrichota bacterium]
MVHIPFAKTGRFESISSGYTHWVVIDSYKNGQNPGWKCYLKPGSILLQSNIVKTGKAPIVYDLAISKCKVHRLLVSLDDTNENLTITGLNSKNKTLFMLISTASGLVRCNIDGQPSLEYGIKISNVTEEIDLPI